MPTDSDSSQPISPDTLALLAFDFLKQITALSLAAAGGAVTLLETAFRESSKKPLVLASVALLFLAAVLSLQAQQLLVDRARAASPDPTERPPSRWHLPRTAKSERLVTVLSYVMFGSGVGALLVALAYR